MTVIAIVLFVLVMSAGVWLLVRNPAMPPPPSEMQRLQEEMRELGEQIKTELLLPMQRAIQKAFARQDPK